MRADRLLSLLLLLQTRGRMTARELAEQLEVSERTIYRDMEALSMAGIPVYAERGPGGGCTLVDGYQTRLTGLTETEVRALFLLNRAGPLTDLGLNQALDDALLKLSASLPAPQRCDAEQVRQRIHLDTTTHHVDALSIHHLQTIQEAIWQERILLLASHEQDKNGYGCPQTVEPYGLVSKEKMWYLVGAVDGEYNVFSVSDIQTMTMTTQRFTRLASFDLPRFWADYCRQVNASRTCPQVRSRQSRRQTQQKKPISIVHAHSRSAYGRPGASQLKKTVSPPRRREAQQKKAIIKSMRSATAHQKEKNGLLPAAPFQPTSQQPLKKTKFPRPLSSNFQTLCA